MPFLKSIWSDPVWSKVISAAVIALSVAGGTYLLSWWPAIGSQIRLVSGFALSSVSLPVWLVGLLAAVASFVAFVMLAAVWASITKRHLEPQWKNYRTDVFDGLQWYWRFSDDGSVLSLYSCCPKCQYQVQAEERGGFTGTHDTSFHCDVCKQVIVRFGEGAVSLESRVTRLIQQKLRTGTWPDANSRS